MTFTLTPDEWTAVALSLKVAVVATLASLPFGIVAAYALARKRFPGRALLDGIIHLPLVLPPVVTGYALLLTFGKRGPLGQALDACCGIVVSFRWTTTTVGIAAGRTTPVGSRQTSNVRVVVRPRSARYQWRAATDSGLTAVPPTPAAVASAKTLRRLLVSRDVQLARLVGGAGRSAYRGCSWADADGDAAIVEHRSVRVGGDVGARDLTCRGDLEADVLAEGLEVVVGDELGAADLARH